MPATFVNAVVTARLGTVSVKETITGAQSASTARNQNIPAISGSYTTLAALANAVRAHVRGHDVWREANHVDIDITSVVT